MNGEPAAIVQTEQPSTEDANREYALARKTQGTIRAAIRSANARLRELKKIQREPRQPRWGGNLGLEMEEQKGLVTLLCLARARHRGRRHVVVMPRPIRLAAAPGERFGTYQIVNTQAQLDALCDEQITKRCIVIEEASPAPAA